MLQHHMWSKLDPAGKKAVYTEYNNIQKKTLAYKENINVPYVKIINMPSRLKNTAQRVMTSAF